MALSLLNAHFTYWPSHGHTYSLAGFLLLGYMWVCMQLHTCVLMHTRQICEVSREAGDLEQAQAEAGNRVGLLILSEKAEQSAS